MLQPTFGKNKTPKRIIGVVNNIRYEGPQQRAAQPEVFELADSDQAMTLVMHFRSGASLSAARLRGLAQAVGPKVVIGKIRPGSEWLDERVATPRHRTMLLGLLGGFGLLLTLIGIFSMTAYAVARRTQEIGVRMAFGARPADVVRTMVRDAAWPLVLGLAIGLVGAYFGTAVVTTFLFHTTPHDPATFVAVAVLMLLTACIAAWLPARRAALVDPVAALRAD
jgi:ABC-type antimicrobial peptide transport system permease subunit